MTLAETLILVIDTPWGYNGFMTVSIEIFRDGVFNLLSDMDKLGLIKITPHLRKTAVTCDVYKTYQYPSEEMEPMYLSESSLAKTWDSPEEDRAWENL